MKLSNYSSRHLPPQINSAQWQAITHEAKHLLIIAGPGTGKTHTLVHRIGYYFEQFNEPSKMVALTFTNKAAEQMRERLNRLLGPSVREMTIGTIHRFCLDILRRYGQEAGLPLDFQVVSSEEIDDLAKELWPDKTVSQRQKCLTEISKEKSREMADVFSSNTKEYDQILRERHRLDFDDLLLETVKLLRKNTLVLKKIRESLRYFFIDEYQDINGIQHTLLTSLIDEDMWVTAIGDPNQSIYGFRGSDVGFFKSFTQDFPSACIVELTENYRSVPQLLIAANQILPEDKPFPVPPVVSKMMRQGRLILYDAPTDKAEAEYIVHQVEKLVGGSSLFSHDSRRVSADDTADRSFGDIAVLYRLNVQNSLLKQAFERSGIPYQVSGEKTFLEQPGIKQVLSCLKGNITQTISPVDSLQSALREIGHISQEDQSRFLAMAERFQHLKEFLDYLAVQRPEDMFFERAEKVSLMTLHAAKGLEFPVVFIVGCEEGITPLNLEILPSNLEEERRLFYVGMTRAKETLYLTRAHRRRLFGQLQEHPPSRFLADIQEEFKEYEKFEGRKLRAKEKPESRQFDLFER